MKKFGNHFWKSFLISKNKILMVENFTIFQKINIKDVIK